MNKLSTKPHRLGARSSAPARAQLSAAARSSALDWRARARVARLAAGCSALERACRRTRQLETSTPTAHSPTILPSAARPINSLPNHVKSILPTRFGWERTRARLLSALKCAERAKLSAAARSSALAGRARVRLAAGCVARARLLSALERARQTNHELRGNHQSTQSLTSPRTNQTDASRPNNQPPNQPPAPTSHPSRLATDKRPLPNHALSNPTALLPRRPNQQPQ